MRYEISAAFAVGVLLPLLETIRRGFGHWAVHTTTMLEDYLGGWLADRGGLGGGSGCGVCEAPSARGLGRGRFHDDDQLD